MMNNRRIDFSFSRRIAESSKKNDLDWRFAGFSILQIFAIFKVEF